MCTPAPVGIHVARFWLRCLFLVALPFALPAQQESQAEAEQRLEALQQDIRSLQEDLSRSRTAQQSEQSALRQLDLRIQENTRTLKRLDHEVDEHRQHLAELEEERDREHTRILAGEDDLSRLLALTYRLARQSRIKLVLNQDDPLRVARLLAYHDYISRAQADRIASLRSTLRELDRLYSDIEIALQGIERLQHEETVAREALQAQREERENLIEELERQIGGGEKRLAELERDRADLERLIERLGDALADIPANLGQEVDLKARKGKLAMPLSAPVRHAFGQPRAAGLRWQGWLLGATPGTEVGAIAHGRVAFADWFRGYGLMLIIDHGKGFLSLYGYNESLLRDVGDWVEPGEAIATVGTGPGGDPGLYFELRRDGKAVDPAAWLDR
ncbi:murein hydrolase activator EnvC family protein [Elongatibacter sediminis]|uniref:Peptidoglycan DD-metalloendopeptidase family protein n=1 Tax=Elongatibacter sediminis TaxID=3119006 RepID=A0AAW9R6C7_9GAMM